jgi:dynein light intermediate chain
MAATMNARRGPNLVRYNNSNSYFSQAESSAAASKSLRGDRLLFEHTDVLRSMIPNVTVEVGPGATATATEDEGNYAASSNNQSTKLVECCVSTESSRAGVEELQTKLDEMLSQLHVRSNPVCPAREEIFASCFDEMIRQTSVECIERGMFLLRVRDEIRLSLMSRLELHKSTVSYGASKAEEKNARGYKQEVLQSEVEKLKSRVLELENKALKVNIGVSAANEERARVFGKEREEQELQKELLTKFLNSVEKSRLPAEDDDISEHSGDDEDDAENESLYGSDNDSDNDIDEDENEDKNLDDGGGQQQQIENGGVEQQSEENAVNGGMQLKIDTQSSDDKTKKKPKKKRSTLEDKNRNFSLTATAGAAGGNNNALIARLSEEQQQSRGKRDEKTPRVSISSKGEIGEIGKIDV